VKIYTNFGRPENETEQLIVCQIQSNIEPVEVASITF